MNYRPYPKYKDSGVEWLGKVPAGWEVTKLKYSASFFGGGTPDKANVEYWGGDIPWISPKDMKTSRINDTEDHITEEAVVASATRVVDSGVVLIVARSGILRHSLPSAINTVPMALNQDMKAIVTSQNLSANFLNYLVAGNQTPLLTEWKKSGTTVESLEHDLIINTLVPIPTLQEQEHIVAFLDFKTAEIDVLIEKKQKLIELLQEKRTAIISHAVTKGLNPKARMKDSGVAWLGEVPEHWEVVRIGRKITLQRGVDITKDEQREGEIPVVSSGGISSYHDIALVEGPGVVVGRKGTAGAVHYLDTDFWPHDTTLWVKELHDNLPKYVFYKLSCMELESFDTGSSNPTVNRNLVHPIHVSWPPKHEQDLIVEHLDRETSKIDSLIGMVKTAIEQLQEYRTALISAAVTGKIDVRSATA